LRASIWGWVMVPVSCQKIVGISPAFHQVGG
jgi:hypothetical protein